MSPVQRFELATDRPRRLSARRSRGSETLHIEAPAASRLREIACESDCTTFAVLTSAFVALLHRYSAETDLAIAVVVPGSHTRLLGCDVSSDPTFTELVRRMKVSATNASLVSERELRSGRFSICATHRRAASRVRAPLVDLLFVATEMPDGWAIACDYDATLFECETIRTLLATLDVLLGAIVADPRARISRLPLVSEAERKRLVFEANRSERPYPAERSVPELVLEHATRTPTAVAVVCGERTLTYAQLEDASNRFARELLARGLAPHKRVGILLERSVDLPVAMLAVLKAGSTYVPLDPDYPRERLAFIARDAMLAAVVSRATLNERLRSDVPFVNIEKDAVAVARHGAERLEAERQPARAPAYIVYTSGSTGKPKGVAVSQRSLVNVLRALSAPDAFDITARDVHVAVATISFDVATLDVFLPLASGAKLVIATESQAADGHALFALLQRSGATFLQATPLTFELLLEAGWRGEPCLKIHCGGDAISRKLADRLLSFGNELWNGYGPTETTITSSILRVRHATGPVLMGPPIANTQFYVLDRCGELVPHGVAGELYIGGAGVSLGYYGRPDLTRERFVPDGFGHASNEDGSEARLYRTGDVVRRRGRDAFEFLGRCDDQVKIRGFRIELGEIEAALLSRPGVCEAVAVVNGGAADEKLLGAFVVGSVNARSLGDAWIADLRAGLSETLPDYMVPASIVVLDALPRTLSGKIDRRSLSAHELVAPPAAQLRIDPNASPEQIEDMLISFAREILGGPGIAPTDDIFTFGFNSLSAMRLVDLIERALNVRIPLRTIYEEPTAERLARRLANATGATASREEPAPIVTLNEHGSRLPFIYFHNDLVADGVYCRRLARSLGSAQPLYAIAPHGTAGLPVRHALEEMARDYLPRIRALQANGPYRLGGLCAGGLVAYEVARLLRAQGEIVERLVLINSWPLSKRAGVACGRLVRAIATERRLPLHFRENFCYNVEGFFDAADTGLRGVSAFFVRRVRAMVRRARGLRASAERIEAFERILRADEKESVIAHLVAPLTYRLCGYDGELTVLWSKDEAMPASAARATWHGLAETTNIIEIPGDYRTLVQDGVEDLALALSGVLDAASLPSEFVGERLESDAYFFGTDRTGEAEEHQRREDEQPRQVQYAGERRNGSD